jgi:hypothetical protein
LSADRRRRRPDRHPLQRSRHPHRPRHRSPQPGDLDDRQDPPCRLRRRPRRRRPHPLARRLCV